MLQNQERHDLLAVFAHAPVAVALLREPDHQLDYWNDLFNELFPGAQAGVAVEKALPALATQQVLAQLDRLYENGESFQGPVVPLPGSGLKRYVTFTYQAYREQERIAGVALFIQDVTSQELARRQTEKVYHQLDAQRHLLSTVFEQAPAGICVVRGPDYVFEVLNPVMAQIIGRSPQQALGRPYFEVLPELVDQGLPELLQQVWKEGKPMFVQELPAQLAYHKPDEAGYFTFAFQPLRNEAGEVTLISCVALDVTTQVQARQQVQVLNKELKASNFDLSANNGRLTRTNADLDTFVYTASHDLRAPISNLEGLVTALRQELLEEPTTEVAYILKLMDDSIKRFHATISQLSDMMNVMQVDSKPQERVAMAGLVEGIQLDLAPLLKQTGAELLVDTAACPAIRASAKDLRSIVYNLLSNAIKYRSATRTPQVQLRTHCNEQWAEVRVQDNGLGLTSEQQNKLFGLFQRLHTHVDGSGVGLYAIKKLIDNAGGTIQVESQVDVGSTFTVRLPQG